MLSSIIPRCCLDACMASRACSHACHAWCCSVPLMIVPPSLLSAPRGAQQSSPLTSVDLPWHGDGFGATGAQHREHSLTWISLPSARRHPRAGCMAPDDGRLHVRAEVMASRQALVTVHAAPRAPAHADALSDLPSLGMRTYGRDATDDLVAENRAVLRAAPVPVQDGEIGVTHTAVFDSDFHVLGPERSELNAFEHHRLFRRLCDPCLMMHRVSYVETSAATRLSVHPTCARSVITLRTFAR